MANKSYELNEENINDIVVSSLLEFAEDYFVYGDEKRVAESILITISCYLPENKYKNCMNNLSKNFPERFKELNLEGYYHGEW